MASPVLMLMVWLGLQAVFNTVEASDGDWEWSYVGDHGPAYWGEHYPDCKGSKNSPVDIKPKDAVLDTTLTALATTNFDGESINQTHLTIENNGHTVRLDVEGLGLAITGSHLATAYALQQFHFHWGTKNSQGSEHQRDGKAYPMEMHIVDWSTKYSTLDEASVIEGGLAAFSVFVEISDTDNANLAKLTDHFDKVKYPGNKTDIEVFPLRDLLPDDLSQFYTYQGGLTTPACSETVTWTLFQNTIKISQAQLDKFRTMIFNDEGEVLEDNFRPVQLLNGRKISTNIPDSDRGVTGGATMMESKMAAIFLLLLTYIHLV